MAITPDDLFSPVGIIDPKMFPGEDRNQIAARLEGYIDNGANDPRVMALPDASQDGAVVPFVYYQAFRDIAIRMALEPQTMTVQDKGSHGYGSDQRKLITDLRDKYLSDFEGLVVVNTSAASPAPITPGTRSVSTDVRWD
jgi:hypothetical protein